MAVVLSQNITNELALLSHSSHKHALAKNTISKFDNKKVFDNMTLMILSLYLHDMGENYNRVNFAVIKREEICPTTTTKADSTKYIQMSVNHAKEHI